MANLLPAIPSKGFFIHANVVQRSLERGGGGSGYLVRIQDSKFTETFDLIPNKARGRFNALVTTPFKTFEQITQLQFISLNKTITN